MEYLKCENEKPSRGQYHQTNPRTTSERGLQSAAVFAFEACCGLKSALRQNWQDAALLRQCDYIPLHPHRFLRRFRLIVNLMQITANSQQQASWRHWRQVLLANTVISSQQILHTIGFRQESPSLKNVNVEFCRCRLITTDEMPRQADSRDRQL